MVVMAEIKFIGKPVTVGNSIGITIPKKQRQELNLKDNEYLVISIQKFNLDNPSINEALKKGVESHGLTTPPLLKVHSSWQEQGLLNVI